MSSVWETRFAEFVRRTLGLRESTQLEFINDVVPSLPVMDATLLDLKRGRGERLFTAGGVILATAAHFPTVWVGNPAKQSIVVLTDLILATNVSTEVRWQPTTVALPGAPVSVSMDDTREPTGTGTAGITVTEDAAAIFPSQRAAFVLAGSHVFPLHIVLAPGQNFRIQAIAAASQMYATIYGYERAVGTAELH